MKWQEIPYRSHYCCQTQFKQAITVEIELNYLYFLFLPTNSPNPTAQHLGSITKLYAKYPPYPGKADI